MHNRCFQCRFEKGVFVDRPGLRNFLTLCNKSCVWIATFFSTHQRKSCDPNATFVTRCKKVVNVNPREAIAKHNFAKVVQKVVQTVAQTVGIPFFCTTFLGPVCFSQLRGLRVQHTVRRTQLGNFVPATLFFFARAFSVAPRRSSVCPAAAVHLTFVVDLAGPTSSLPSPVTHARGQLTQWQFGLKRSSKRVLRCPKVAVCVVMCWLVVTGVYGRDNVNLAFSEDGPFSEMKEL